MAPPAVVMPAMQNSPLARLPSEIRDSIYKLCLTQETKIDIINKRCSDSKRRLRLRCARKNAIAISQACKQTRTESAFIFFTYNTFEIIMPEEHVPAGRQRIEATKKLVHTLQKFLRIIGPDNEAALRQLFVYVPSHKYYRCMRGDAVEIWRPLLVTLQELAIRNKAVRLVAYSWLEARFASPSGHQEYLKVEIRDAVGCLENFLKATAECESCQKNHSVSEFALLYNKCIKALRNPAG